VLTGHPAGTVNPANRDSEASFITGQAIVVDGGYSADHSHGLVELMGIV